MIEKHPQRKTETMHQRIDPQLKADLEELAKSSNRSLSNFVDTILKQYIEAKKKKRRPR